MYLILHWLFSAFILLGLDYFVPGISISGIYIALIASLIIGIINAVLKPILVFLTLPINILTLGLFTWVINGLLFWFVSSFVEGFFVSGFWVAILGALILSAGNWFINEILKES